MRAVYCALDIRHPVPYRMVAERIQRIAGLEWNCHLQALAVRVGVVGHVAFRKWSRGAQVRFWTPPRLWGVGALDALEYDGTGTGLRAGL